MASRYTDVLFRFLLPAAAGCMAASAAAQEWYLTIGPGGITKKEIEVYLVRYRREVKKSRAELTDEDLRQVIARAVQEELLFQGALAEKLHLEDEHIRRRIMAEYRSHHTVGRINPNLFSDRERRAYYKAHPEEFMTPARIRIQVLRARAGLKEQLARIEAARRRPGGGKG